MSRLKREQKIVAVMIHIFCGAHHGTAKKHLCSACSDLLEYAKKRLEKCPFGQEKGACSQCRIHCYKQDMRERITRVMRYSGPKMIKRHPLLALDHLLKARALRARKSKEQAVREITVCHHIRFFARGLDDKER